MPLKAYSLRIFSNILSKASLIRKLGIILHGNIRRFIQGHFRLLIADDCKGILIQIDHRITSRNIHQWIIRGKEEPIGPKPAGELLGIIRRPDEQFAAGDLILIFGIRFYRSQVRRPAKDLSSPSEKGPPVRLGE